MLRREKKKTKKILSDKITDLLTVAPSADVEDDQVFGTKPKTVTIDDLDSDADSVEEAALSNFRKQNASLLAEISDRYAGEVTSKKDLGFENKESDDDSVEVDSVDLADNFDEFQSENSDEDIKGSQDEKVDTGDDSQDEEKLSDDEDGSDYDSDMEGSDEGFNISEIDGDKFKVDDNFKHFKPKDTSEEVEKGICVKNQLDIWENLLEMRISMQKCLATANKMPLQEKFKLLKKDGGAEFNILANKTKGSAVTLLSRLLDLQNILVSQYSETKNLFNKNEQQKEISDDPMDEEIPSDEEIESEDSDADKEGKMIKTEEKPVEKAIVLSRKRKLEDYSSEIADRHAIYGRFRDGIIQKWNDKTKIMGVKKDQATAGISVLSQIDYILGDKNKLIRRTQLKRSKYDILGESKKDDEEIDGNCDKPEDVDRKILEDEYCTEIFDDDDFYHQQLRELIEYKSADISDPIQLSRQWIMLQQIRSKMKRKIDTRATKGRKIRYAVHSKLLNFMAPEVNYDWTDEMKDELYASLFGKQFENNVDASKNKNETNGGLEIMKS